MSYGFQKFVAKVELRSNLFRICRLGPVGEQV